MSNALARPYRATLLDRWRTQGGGPARVSVLALGYHSAPRGPEICGQALAGYSL